MLFIKINNDYLVKARCHDDALRIAREYDEHFNQTQGCSDGEEKTIKTMIIRDTYHRRVHLVEFDFENSEIKINERKFKVENDSNIVYKTFKTKIKACDGIKGIQRYFLESADSNDLWNISLCNSLVKAGVV